VGCSHECWSETPPICTDERWRVKNSVHKRRHLRGSRNNILACTPNTEHEVAPKHRVGLRARHPAACGPNTTHTSVRRGTVPHVSWRWRSESSCCRLSKRGSANFCSVSWGRDSLLLGGWFWEGRKAASQCPIMVSPGPTLL